MHRRVLSVALLATVLASLTVAAAAERYVSEFRQFEVTIPDGWEHQPINGEMLQLGMTSPRVATTRGICMILKLEVSETLHMTQKEINESGAKDINDDFWRTMASEAGSKNVTVQARSEMREDRRVYLATLRYSSTVDGEEFAFHSEMLLHAIPGRLLASNCLADQAQIAAEATDFKIVSDSFNPLGSGVIARVQPPRTSAPLATPRMPYAGARSMLTTSLKEATGRSAKHHAH